MREIMQKAPAALGLAFWDTPEEDIYTTDNGEPVSEPGYATVQEVKSTPERIREELDGIIEIIRKA
jgi:hypothetical protein